MSESCQAVIGYLVPRRSCTQASSSTCGKCQTRICAEHATVDNSGVLCPMCANPALWNSLDLKNQTYFNEADLDAFVEAYRTQKGKRDPWVEFT